MKTTTHPTRLLHDTDKARQLPWVPSYSVAQEGVLARWMKEQAEKAERDFAAQYQAEVLAEKNTMQIRHHR